MKTTAIFVEQVFVGLIVLAIGLFPLSTGTYWTQP